MIRSVLYLPAEDRLREGGAELIDVWEREPASTIWVALEAEPVDAERAVLAGRFGIHRLAITDALRERHPPKIEPFTGNTFILLRGLDATSTSLEFGTIQLSIFVGDRFLVTRNSGRSVSTDEVMAALLAATSLRASRGPDSRSLCAARSPTASFRSCSRSKSGSRKWRGR